MKASFRFLEWQVYEDAKALFRLTLDIVSRLPKEIRYDLGGQIIRASSSVIFNIAEGSGKRSGEELNRTYLKIGFRPQNPSCPRTLLSQG
jgi:hypothetical protein